MVVRKYILNQKVNCFGIAIKQFSMSQEVIENINSIPQKKPIEVNTDSASTNTCKKKISHLTGGSEAEDELQKQLDSLAKEPNLFFSLPCPHLNSPHEELLNDFRENFIKSLCCYFPESWGFWCIKPHQTEGRPYYHMLIYVDPAHLPAIDIWIRDRWFKVIGAIGDDDFSIVDVRQITDRNLNGLKDMKMYMAKDELPALGAHWSPIWQHGLGQRWGRFGVKNIPFLEKTGVEITKKQYEQIRDVIIASLEKEIAALRTEQVSASCPRSFMLSNILAEKQKHLEDIRKGRCAYYPNDPDLNIKIESILKG